MLNNASDHAHAVKKHYSQMLEPGISISNLYRRNIIFGIGVVIGIASTSGSNSNSTSVHVLLLGVSSSNS